MTIVYGEGPKPARIMLIGQNPGAEEAKRGRPFVGRSGRYLDKILNGIGIDRETVYITGAVKETTPKNRKPTREEMRRWLPLLIQEIMEVQPEIVVLMGQVAWETPRSKDIQYIETYHPAAAMRFPKIRRKFEADMEGLRGLL